MKKIGKLFIVCLILVGMCHPGWTRGLKGKIYFNYCLQTDSAYKNVYSNGLIMPGIQLNYNLSNNIEFYGEIQYCRCNGEMTVTAEKTTLTLIPIFIGSRSKPLQIKIMEPYLGMGMNLTCYHENLPERPEDMSGTSKIGFFLEIGTYLPVFKRLSIDVNLRYTFANAESDGETLNLGGYSLGIGFIYRF